MHEFQSVFVFYDFFYIQIKVNIMLKLTLKTKLHTFYIFKIKKIKNKIFGLDSAFVI